MKIILSSALSILLFAACATQSAEVDKNLQQWAKDSGTILNNTVSADTAALTETTPIVAPVATSPVTAPAITAPASSQALNPAHGMPGHRCDIAVGAPLNSPAQAVQPVSPAVSLPAAPAGATGKLNPPHGQPGHRCDIQVGAPLNS